MGFQVVIYVLFIALLIAFISSKSPGHSSRLNQLPTGPTPDDEDKVSESENDTEVTAVVTNWQNPKMAAMVFRRIIGALVATGVYILFNPIGEKSYFFAPIVGAVLGILAGIYLNPGNLFNVPFRQYVKWYRLYSFKGQARQVIAFDGKAGWQSEKKLPGWRYVIVAWNDVAYYNFTQVPSNAVWYIISRIGENLLPGRKTAMVMKSLDPYEDPELFIDEKGQLSVQRTILTPGYIGPIDLVAFEVDDGNQPTSSSNKQFYKPYRVPDDKFAMVTCLDSSHPLPEGAIFARVNGFDDIQQKIKAAFGDDEAELRRETTRSEVKNQDEALIVAKSKPKEQNLSTLSGLTDQANDTDTSANPLQSIFRKDLDKERSLAGECLRLLLKGPQEELEDYQNIAYFDEKKGTVGPHWRLIKPGRLLNLNRFVFDVTLVDPLEVKSGECRVLILTTGVLARDITKREFPGARIVRMGGNGINLKALEPSKYPIPSDLLQSEVIPIRQLSLYFEDNKSNNDYDTELKTIKARTPDGIDVSYDLNVLLTIPAEAASLVVSAFGDGKNFIKEIVATIIIGETVRFIRTTLIEDIVKKTDAVLKLVEDKLIEEVQNRYGIIIHAVKLERFDAEKYLPVLEKKAIAEARLQAILAEKLTADKDQELQTSLGQAQANLKKAVAAGEAEAIKLTLGALVEKFGEEGATLIQALKEMTGGEHPFMPQVLGLSTGDGNAAGGYMPVAAMLTSLVDKYTNSSSEKKKKTEKKEAETSTEVSTQ